MSLFSKKPKSIADFEKEIEKLRHKKKLSARNSERLEEYEKQLSSLKTAEEAAQKKKARQKKIAIGSIAASVALITCIIIPNCLFCSSTLEREIRAFCLSLQKLAAVSVISISWPA